LAEVMAEVDYAQPGKTDSGQAWLRWSNGPVWRGWYAIGTREPNFGARPSFWEQVLLLGMRVMGNARMDAAHAIGPAVIACGAMGWTLDSGSAQTLLGRMLVAAPARVIGPIARLVHAAGVYPGPSGDGFVLRDVASGGPLVERAELERVVRAGGDGYDWSPAGKKLAFRWLDLLTGLLRDDVFDHVQAELCAELMPLLLTDATREEIRWPKSAARDAWQYTPEQAALWAIALVLSTEHAAELERLLFVSGSQGINQIGAGDRILAMRTVDGDMTYADRFRARATRAIDGAIELFRADVR
jgi:hypothetical protein